MKAEANESFVGQLAGQAQAFAAPRQRAMKRGVEAGHLRPGRKTLGNAVDRGQGLRKMVGGQRNDFVEIGPHTGVDAAGLAIIETAVDQAMPHAHD